MAAAAGGNRRRCRRSGTWGDAQPSSVEKESVFVASGPVVVENQVDVGRIAGGPVVTIPTQPGTLARRGPDSGQTR